MSHFAPRRSSTKPLRLTSQSRRDDDIESLESRVLMSGSSPGDLFANASPGPAAVVMSLASSAPKYVSASPVAAPASPKVSYALASGRGTITLTWSGSDPKTTGYVIWRAIGTSGTFSVAAKLAGVANRTFTDIPSLANTNYSYKITAGFQGGYSDPSATVSLITPMSAPGNVAAQMTADTTTGGTYVSVFWAHADANVTGFSVFRAVGNGAFAQVGQSTGRTYADRSTLPNTLYRYQVQALAAGRSSAVSGTATLTTTPAKPTGLAAAVASGKVTLTWAANDPKATGYTVWRSSDGITFKSIATVTGAATKSYIDTTLAAGSVGYYKVVTIGPGGSSTSSNAVEARIPATSKWTITTRYGNELVLNNTGAGDTFSVSQSGADLVFTINGVSVKQAASAGGLYVYLRGGNNTLTIDASVSTRVTVQTINGLNDKVSVSIASANVWIDNDDTFAGSAQIHRVASFVGGVSKAQGASLPNPTDVRSTVTLNQSLLGTGVAAADANQGQVGDCYFISTLSSLAHTSPSIITNSVVDMGDGTYTVQFFSAGKAQYYRVNNQFATAGAGLTNLYYANGGSSGKIWISVFEKAFAHFRRGANTYASLNGGYFNEVNDALGVKSTNFNPAAASDANLYTMLASKLSTGKAVEFATSNTSPNLVRSHGYSLLSVSKVNGVNTYTVRNPWGASGNALESRTGIANLTYAQLTANFAGGTMAA
jgi:hypothetical protein